MVAAEHMVVSDRMVVSECMVVVSSRIVVVVEDKKTGELAQECMLVELVQRQLYVGIRIVNGVSPAMCAYVGCVPGGGGGMAPQELYVDIVVARS